MNRETERILWSRDLMNYCALFCKILAIWSAGNCCIPLVQRFYLPTHTIHCKIHFTVTVVFINPNNLQNEDLPHLSFWFASKLFLLIIIQ